MLGDIKQLMLDHNLERKILFVDFDGILCHDRFWRSLSPTLRSSVDQFLFSEHFPIVVHWMRGHSASEEVNEVLAHFVGIAYRHLWHIFVHDCRTMNVSLAHLKSIQKIRKFMPVVLVTGNMDCFERFTIPALGLREYFNDIVNSANTGELKTDNGGQLFVDLCTKYNRRPADALLIDDSLKNRNIMTGIGGQALNAGSWQDLSDLLWEIERAEYFKRGAILDESGTPEFPPFRWRTG